MTLRFRVPASTTNLAHGFDCLGAALGISNTIIITPGDGDVVSAGRLPDTGLAELAARCRDACASRWQVELPGFDIDVEGEVPLARGMGSSATILVGVAAACRQLAELPPDADELVRVTALVEGHPDNVAAAALGGFTIAAVVDGELRVRRLAAPNNWRAVVAIPDYEVRTADAREALPSACSAADLVTAVQRTALLVGAIAEADLDALAGVFADGWHERYRGPLVRELADIRQAAAEAGAAGTFLSGSGSTMLSLCDVDRAERVAAALRAHVADVRVLGFDDGGVQAG